MDETPFQTEHFQREDEDDDALFYLPPRLLAHIDDEAIAAVGRAYAELLPRGGSILDLMSSYLSHMPDEVAPARLAGLGMNEAELRANSQLTEYVVHDLNRDPVLPYGDGEFDGAVVTVSAQYLTNPVEVFRDVARVLRPNAPFVVTYSNRMFPTKAVRIWRMLDDRDRASLIGAYFKHSRAFGEVKARDYSSGRGDPLFAVWAHARLDEGLSP
jgi:SAM-dependent methyltransferase